MQASCLLDSADAVTLWARGAGDAISGIYGVRAAREPWEIGGYYALRRATFCREQALFAGDDRDDRDAAAQPIVAVSYAAGMGDEVVGTVRIDQPSPGVWYGSRLSVARDWRGVAGLAASLIRAAVTSASAQGCEQFLATVQRANVPLFRRLHWRTLGELDVCGRPHHLMTADLSRYLPLPPPIFDFAWGQPGSPTARTVS